MKFSIPKRKLSDVQAIIRIGLTVPGRGEESARIWKGSYAGDGIEGAPANDIRIDGVEVIDFNKVDFGTGIPNGEFYTDISVEVRRQRMLEKGLLPLNLRVAHDLLMENEHTTLNWIHGNRGIKGFLILGTAFKLDDDRPYYLKLYRDIDRWCHGFVVYGSSAVIECAIAGYAP